MGSMGKTKWTRNDNYVVTKNYLAGISYEITANVLQHLKKNSIRLKYNNCLYLERGDVSGSLKHASSIHKEVWKELTSG
jgi:hypothetical protein